MAGVMAVRIGRKLDFGRLSELQIAAFVLLMLAGCAAQAPPRTEFVPLQHVAANSSSGQAEHDAVYYPAGELDYFPSRAKFQRIVAKPSDGGTLDLQCMNDSCNELLVRSNGLKRMADGSFDLTQLDSRTLLVRDGQTKKTLGYWVLNDKGQLTFADTLDQAHAAESNGSTLKTVGRAALATVLIAGVLAGAAAAAAAAAPPINPEVVYIVPTPVVVNAPGPAPKPGHKERKGWMRKTPPEPIPANPHHPHIIAKAARDSCRSRRSRALVAENCYVIRISRISQCCWLRAVAFGQERKALTMMRRFRHQ
jgi:hypothetical protein